MTDSKIRERWLGIIRSVLVVGCAVAFAAIVTPRQASAQTYSVIHNFTGGPGGQSPFAGVVADGAGNLYGTTSAGGGGTCNGSGCGTAFRLNPSTGVFTLLWQFTGGTDGAGPTTALFVPEIGLYVITAGGGNNGCGSNYLFAPGCGTIVRLSPRATPPRNTRDSHWIESILYKFRGFPNDGSAPAGNLALDNAGNLYGTTNTGGTEGPGTVFQLSHSNGSWRESTLHNFFQGLDGGYPFGGVTLDAAGNLYGTASTGGGSDSGVVFQLIAASGWRENPLFSFDGGMDGAQPLSGVAVDSFGNLYGSTSGAECGNDGGTVFELNSRSWTYSTIYCLGGHYGGGPYFSTLIIDAMGNLYGTTYGDGTNNYGSVFKLTPSNGTWTYISLHDFTGGSDGGYPVGNLLFDFNGNLYGTASLGGDLSTCGGHGCGVIFKITP